MASTAGRKTYKPIDLREHGHNACLEMKACKANNSLKLGVAARVDVRVHAQST